MKNFISTSGVFITVPSAYPAQPGLQRDFCRVYRLGCDHIDNINAAGQH